MKRNATILLAVIIVFVLASNISDSLRPARERNDVAVGFIRAYFTATTEDGQWLEETLEHAREQARATQGNQMGVYSPDVPELDAYYHEKYDVYLTEHCLDTAIANGRFSYLPILADRIGCTFQPQNIRLVKEEERSEDYEFWDVIYALDVCQSSAESGEVLQTLPLEIEFYLIREGDGCKIRWYREYYQEIQLWQELYNSGR